MSAKPTDRSFVIGNTPPRMTHPSTAESAAVYKNQTQSQSQTPMSELYPQYYKKVGNLTEIDVYAVHFLFDIQDPSGIIQHASKKLLLSGNRTGGKSSYDDIKEARDSLNRYLELHAPTGASLKSPKSVLTSKE